MRYARPLVIGATALTGLTLAACDGKSGDAASAQGGTIAVTATDSKCTAARTESSAGAVKFAIANKGAKVTEFYVYAAGDRVMGEQENIPPGLTRELLIQLDPGTYEVACKPGMSGKGIRTSFTVTGTAKTIAPDAKAAQAAASYQRYVQSQTTALIEKSTEFVDAVKAGDVAKAKALYPVARTYWERIEPAAEVFGPLDPAVDGREDAIEPGQDFTGFHRLEKDLWVTGNVSASGLIADRLLTDLKKIAEEAKQATLTPVQLANGAKELLDEVATGKITGEEDRYSHTDLWDFAANVEGSKAALAAVRPLLDERDAALGKTLDERFTAVETALGQHRQGDGWQSHDTLSPAQLKDLADQINALAEPVSRVAAAVVS